MGSEFRWSLAVAAAVQALLGWAAWRSLGSPEAREVALFSQFLSSSNLLLLFTAAGDLLGYTRQEPASRSPFRVLRILFLGGLKLICFMGLIFYLAGQRRLGHAPVLWGISPWVVTPMAVGVLGVLRNQRRKNRSAVARLS
jgi:hypothetical protein